jgi:hypothetical protein
MKHTLLSIFCAILLTIGFSLKSQTISWEETFESYNGFGDSPVGFTGDLKVYLGHGNQGGKGLSAQHSTFNSKDSTITPTINNVLSNSVFTFEYRFATYTGTTPTFDFPLVNESVQFFIAEESATDWGTPVLTINSTNDTAAIPFRSRNINLAAFAGQNIKIKIKSLNPSNREYWLDLDNLKVASTDNSTSIQKSKSSAEFFFYPNPASDIVTIQSAEGGQLEMLNMLGAVVLKRNINASKFFLELEQFPRGVYYLKVEHSGKTNLKKLVLK